MSTKKKLYPFLLFKSCIALSALLTSSLLFGGIVNNNFPGNDYRDSYESTVDSARCADLSNDSLKRFVRFDHTDGAFDYYSIRLSMFNSSSERGYFYQAARASEIYMNDKGEFDKDSTLFMTGNMDKMRTLHLFCDLYEQTINTRQPLPFSGSGPFKQPSSPLGEPTCNTAQVSCSGNVYTYPSGTTGSAPPPILGYPNYGCLGSEPCPAYYYLQVSMPGDIIILIQQGANDVDFICWGPFNSLTDGCAYGLTGTCNVPFQPPCCNNTDPGCTLFYPRGNITDCSFSGYSTETCHIPNAQVGEMYILLITNYSQQSGTITFQQTGGTGVTDCNIVVFCSMIAITANPSACDGLTNTFSISGNIEFSNPPPTGTLTVTDNTAVPPVSQTLSPPFVSPMAYNLAGISCDGAVHFLTAAFSDSVTCTMTEQFTSPPASCPQADISGGGEICNDGISETTVNIDISGSLGPYNFTYAINGISQTPVTNYSGTLPYLIITKIPGLYTLVSVSNQVCPTGGIVSGSATVVVNSLPVPSFITGENSVCLNIPGKIYTTEAGKSNYIWTIPPQATITAGGTVNDNSVTLTWNTLGTFSISVNYSEPTTGCTAASPTSYPVTVNPLPTPSFTSGENSVCLNISDKVYTTQAGKLNYIWNIPPQATVTAGGTVNDNSVTLTWNTVGTYSISVNYSEPTTGCTAASPTSFDVTVKSLPVPSFTTGENSVCLNIPGKVYTTEAGKSNYIWNIPPQATITSGGTGTDNSITLTWNTAGSYAISVNYTEPTTQCTAASPTPFSVTVNPLPVPSVAGPAAVCLNSTSTYHTDAGMTNYLWSVSAGGSITSGIGTNSIDILWNTTGVKTITVNYNDANGCTAAAPFPYSVTVTTLPVPALNGLNTICSGNSTTYTTDAGMNNYLWLISAGGTKTSGGSATDNTVTVTWNIAGDDTVSVNYSMGIGCTAANPTELIVNVKPRPSITNAANPTICSNTTTNIPLLASLPLTSFTWTATESSGSVSGHSNSGGPVISQTLINSGFNIETVDYAVTPSLNGCDGAVVHFIVTVDPVADAYFNPNGQTLCSGTTTSISILSHVASTTFTWNGIGSSGNISGFGPGATSSISQTLTNIGTGTETVTYTISPSFNNCPGTPNSVVVTVMPNPSVAFTPCTDITTTTDAKPFTLRGGTPLGGTYSGTGVNSGIFFPSLAGPGTHTILYSYTNTNNCSSNASLNISVIDAMAFTCDNTLTDVRDNAQYLTVKIGTQCWMAANLNYGTPILFASTQMQRDNCIFEKYCFNDNLANCTSYGGLYQWDELMQYDNAAAAQGFCPPGWHVPTENEWTTLFNFYISNGFAGAPLKYSGYSGFNAFLSGTRFNNVNWNFSNFAVMFWSSTSHGPTKAWAHGMNFFNSSVSFYPSSRSNAFSVRCIKD